jgi:putative ABC transport system ATP-binding protein
LSADPVISAEGLSHSFGRGAAARTVLQNVNVHFYAGEIVIVMGPSGSGKTTLLTLVGALRAPQSGSVRVVGRELRGASERLQLEVRQHVGFIFQHHNLLESLSALENVQMGLAHDLLLPVAESRRRARELLMRVGLEDHLHKRPPELSGGQRQRVAIARALVREPAIVLADEPTAALDSHSGREVVELLLNLAREQQCAILLVTHDNRILDVADRILMLEDGCIEENNRALDRLRTDLAGLAKAIARYPALFLSGSPAAAAEQANSAAEQLAQRRREAATHASRKLGPAVRRQTAALADAAELLVRIEASARQFCAMAAPSGTIGTGTPSDRLFQSLEFLLLATADAIQAGTPEELERLVLLTTDRGEMMKTLRSRQCDALSPEFAETLVLFYDLTDVFSRTVYFLHELAACWIRSQA